MGTIDPALQSRVRSFQLGNPHAPVAEVVGHFTEDLESRLAAEVELRRRELHSASRLQLQVESLQLQVESLQRALTKATVRAKAAEDELQQWRTDNRKLLRAEYDRAYAACKRKYTNLK